MKRIAIIMAGGSGERFWPLSRIKKPKQMLMLTAEDKSMLELSIERLIPLINAEDIYIITSATLLQVIQDSISIIPKQNIIAEPAKRNTAPCLALAAAFIKAKYEHIGLSDNDISMAVLAADHNIESQEQFQLTLNRAFSYVEANNTIATIGIKPSRVETGYGYIELASEIANSRIFQVNKFKEKPNYETAKSYIESGEYLWNSGMFFWRLDHFVSQMHLYVSDVASSIDTMALAYQNHTDEIANAPLTAIKETFEALPNISIDYALLEKAKDVVVVLADFTWDDLGSWDSLDRVLEKDEHNNVIQNQVISIENSNSILINQNSNGMILSALGLDNFVVVVTDDSIMICPKDRVQDIKKIVIELNEQNKKEYL